MQKKAIRIITHSTYTASTEPLFTSLKILPFYSQITLSNLSLMHSTHHSYAPKSLLNLWPKNSLRNLAMNLRNSDDYSLPKVNHSLFKKFPAYSLPLLWNTYKGSSILHGNRFTFLTSLKYELQNPTPSYVIFKLNPKN